MGIFSRKRKVLIGEFCREFYDKAIFAPKIAGSDPWKLFCESCYKFIKEDDHTFGQVDLSSFTLELLAIRLEVFGVAWLHHVNDKFAPRQSEFTKSYLEELEHTDIWKSMGNYNQAIARSTTGDLDPNSKSDRAYNTFLNSLRVDFFNKWSVGYDSEAVARAANRLESFRRWKSMGVHSYLSIALTDQLLCEVNDEAIYRITVIIQGFYNGAWESIKEVKIIDY